MMKNSMSDLGEHNPLFCECVTFVSGWESEVGNTQDAREYGASEPEGCMTYTQRLYY